MKDHPIRHPEYVVTYSNNQLQEAFEAVQNPDDWKGPIDSVVHIDALAKTLCAIEYMTGTKPNIFPNVTWPYYNVTSVGYRNGPCGP